MKRIEKYREHSRPCERHQKWRGDLIDQVPEQQQRPVRKDGRYLVTRRRVSFADRLRHRYIITLLSRHQGYGQDRRKLRMSSSPIPLSRYQYRLLAVLALVNFVNFGDRQVFIPLLPLIRAHLGVSDAQLGSLQTWLLIVLAVASLLFGLLADRLSRRAVIAFGVVFWSLATFASGLASTFTFLLFSRALVGVGEGAYAPAAQSMISGAFPQERRAFAQAIFATGMLLGGASGLAIGGILGEHHPWQHVFYLAALAGLLPGLAILWIEDPPRGPRTEVVPFFKLLSVPA